MKVRELLEAMKDCQPDDSVGIGVLTAERWDQDGGDVWLTQPVGNVVTGPGIVLIRSGGDRYKSVPHT